MRYRRATLLPLCFFPCFVFSSHGIEPAILDVRITNSYCGHISFHLHPFYIPLICFIKFRFPLVSELRYTDRACVGWFGFVHTHIIMSYTRAHAHVVLFVALLWQSTSNK